jgi:hypothetical protein
VPTKVASSFLRRTITASQPKNLQQMWLASGISSYVADVTTTKAPSLASASAGRPVLLSTESADKQAPSQQPPERATAPRRSRARRPGKPVSARIRVAPRSSGRKAGKSRRKAAKT